MVEGGGIGLYVDTGERDASGAALRDEGGGKQLWVYVFVQFGKDSLKLSASDA